MHRGQPAFPDPGRELEKYMGRRKKMLTLFRFTVDTEFPAFMCAGGVSVRHPDDPRLSGWIEGVGTVVAAAGTTITPGTWLVKMGGKTTVAGREVTEVFPVQLVGGEDEWSWAESFRKNGIPLGRCRQCGRVYGIVTERSGNRRLAHHGCKSVEWEPVCGNCLCLQEECICHLAS